MKLLSVAAGLALGLLLALSLPFHVSAHHPVVISADAVCQGDGSWLVTWTADADAVRGFDWWLTAPVDTSASPVPDSQSITFRTREPGAATSASVVVSAEWSNGATGTRTGTTQLPTGPCPPETSTTSTTSSSTTTSSTTTSTTVPDVTSTVPCPPGTELVLDSCIPIQTTSTTTTTEPFVPTTTTPPSTVPPRLPDTGPTDHLVPISAVAAAMIAAGVILVRRT